MSKYEGTVLRCHFSIDERRSKCVVAVAAFKRQENERGSRCLFCFSPSLTLGESTWAAFLLWGLPDAHCWGENSSSRRQKEGPEQETCHGAWGLAPPQPAPELAAFRWGKEAAWLVPSDVPDGQASPCPWAPAPGGSGLAAALTRNRRGGGPGRAQGRRRKRRPLPALRPLGPADKAGRVERQFRWHTEHNPCVGTRLRGHRGTDTSLCWACLAAAGEVAGAGVYMSGLRRLDEHTGSVPEKPGWGQAGGRGGRGGRGGWGGRGAEAPAAAPGGSSLTL